MEFLKKFGREIKMSSSEILLEAPSAARLLSQDVSQSFQVMTMHGLRMIYQTSPVAVDFLAGLGLVASGSFLLIAASEKVTETLGNFLSKKRS